MAAIDTLTALKDAPAFAPQAASSEQSHIRRENGMIVKVRSATVHGVEALMIEVEVDNTRGQANVAIVGLPDKAVNESKERVHAAIQNAGYDFPVSRITINLAPADLKKEGPGFDLPIAVGILAVSHQIDPDAVARYAMVGELALDGRVRPIAGILPIVSELKRRRFRGVIVPEANATEAGVVHGIEVYPVSHLREVVGLLNGTYVCDPFRTDLNALLQKSGPTLAPDFADVMGHESVKRAVVVAAAGGHNMLMIGNPGVGKSMIARRIPGVLPEMTIEEALETTKVYSSAGSLSKDQPFITQRPFRAPHHTISDVGLIGGGANPRPGEVSHAHNGVLFLDELPEFNRKTLEVMRQPLEDGHATITRASGNYRFPARFTLVAAMNPCPCGYLGHPTRKCSDTGRQVLAYRNRISGPLMDRIDIHLDVPAVEYDRLKGEPSRTDSATMARLVCEARARQQQRYRGTGVGCNAQMTDRMLREFAVLDDQANRLLDSAMRMLSLSTRAFARIKKLARTIADLGGSERILTEHVSEAIGYRSLDRNVS